MDWPFLVAVAGAAALVAWAGTGALLKPLRRHAVLDHPNSRSSHAVPTPRGGGIAVVGGILAGAAIAAGGSGAVPWPVLAAMAALAAISWVDDVRGLPALPRFAGQAAAAAVVLWALPWDGLVFQGLLPPVADRVAAVLAWLYFINLFNFMDGIDGITGVEAACIGGGLFVVAALAGDAVPLALAAAAAALGFLWWNWHPARIFLGDVGSIALGFLLGWLLLDLAARGQWAAALLLPGYYLADASLTLLRRLLRGEKLWRAHREHFYQRAVQAGMSHAAVARAVLAAGIGLAGLAALSVAGGAWQWTALIAGAALVAALLLYLRRPVPSPQPRRHAG